MKRNKFVFCLYFLLFFTFSHAQKPEVIDSLWNKYKFSENDSIKLKAANFLAFHYIFKTPNRADSILSSETNFAKENNQNFGLTELTNTRGVYHAVLGEKDSSRIYFKKALKMSRDFEFANIEVMSINNLGMFHWNNGEFKEAIKYFYDALDFSKTNFPDNERTLNTYLNNIGLIYQELEQYQKAVDYHSQALEIRIKFDLTKNIAQSYNNLAICTKELGALEKAEEYINSAIDFAQKSNQPQMVYAYYDNLGNILNLQEKYPEAINAYLKALEMPEEFGNSKNQKFIAYSNLINAYNNTRQYQKAIQTISRADYLFKQDSTLYNFSGSFLENSAKTYYAIRNNEKGDEYFESYLQFKDSLFSKENAAALADVEARLKTKEKEAELAETKNILLKKEIEVQQKNLLLYGTLSAILVIIVIGYLIIKSKQLKTNQIKKEAELQSALSKIELKNRLEEQRLRISRDLHDNIGSQLTFVVSSLQFLQLEDKLKLNDVKTKIEKLSQFTRETIHELRDTIWAMNKEEIPLFELIDRLKKYINQINLKENISISIPNEKQLMTNTILFNAVEGIQIFRMVQESINNSVKHAEAEEIKVLIFRENGDLKFEIIDNGNGFDVDEVTLGNGIKNIENRAKQLQAKFEIYTEPKKGTTIAFKLPIKNDK